MDKEPNWWQRRKISISMGRPTASWHLMNDGNPVENTIIRFKDLYLEVTLDAETKEPTGDFAWSRDPHMFPDVNINDFWTATAPKN
jgi:hypothetical protein